MKTVQALAPFLLAWWQVGVASDLHPSSLGRPLAVTEEMLVAAMQTQTGYDVTATTNVARFEGNVLLLLARQAQARNPQGSPLLIKHDDWFRAFLRVTHLSPQQAPLFSRLAFEHRQQMLVDYRAGGVVKAVTRGPTPKLAVNVLVSWPQEPGSPQAYSFEDTLSTPHLRVTNHRVITYRLLEYDDMLVYDEVSGLTGRPTTGLLGLLFKLVGDSRAIQSRLSISADGLQVNRTRVKKGGFRIEATVTIQPDGRAHKGLPQNRPDLRALERRLKRPIAVRYHPFPPLEQK
ncbi:MAG: hypothetical protein D6743_15605 [Calditrichaeota bacterium]|nr:MAG: hypothetical protein D6743_15605 [Calditrichota bacterium]